VAQQISSTFPDFYIGILTLTGNLFKKLKNKWLKAAILFIISKWTCQVTLNKSPKSALVRS